MKKLLKDLNDWFITLQIKFANRVIKKYISKYYFNISKIDSNRYEPTTVQLHGVVSDEEQHSLLLQGKLPNEYKTMLMEEIFKHAEITISNNNSNRDIRPIVKVEIKVLKKKV